MVMENKIIKFEDGDVMMAKDLNLNFELLLKRIENLEKK